MERSRSFLTLLAAAALWSALPGVTPLAATDWPRWSGPERDLTVRAGDVFPDAGFALEKVWSRPIGPGYSGSVISGGRLVTAFSDGARDVVAAFDATDGRELWRRPIAETYRGHDGSADGPIATPAIAGDLIYALGRKGHLLAVRLADGEKVWARHLEEEWGARRPHYGFSTAPTVVGEVLVVAAGGDGGRSILGIDRRSGELRWSAGDDTVDHQSPLVLAAGGGELIFAVTNEHLWGLDPASGEVLWKREHPKQENEGFAQPVPVGDDGVLVAHWPESVLFRVVRGEDGDLGVEEVWRSRALRSTYTVPVYHEGHLYGLSGRILTCVDAATGEAVWKSRPPGGGHLMLVDGHLVIQAPSGELVVVEATPEGYREKARVEAFERGNYIAPSFAHGRVYARNQEELASFRVAPSEVSTAATGRIPDAELRGELGRFVRRLMAAEKKDELIDEFLRAHERFPIREGELVHFVYRGDVPDLVIVGNMFNGGTTIYNEEVPLHRVPGTDFFFKSVELEPRAHYTYHFLVFDQPLLDPLNPDVFDAEEGLSVLTTAGYEPPEHLRPPEGPRGRLEGFTWESEILANERPVQVYLPPGYDRGEERYPLLVVNHGDEAVELGRLPTALDNLIGDGKMAPVVAVFVPRGGPHEYNGSHADRYAKGLAEELLPRLESTYRLLGEPGDRAVMGVGSAGFVSFFITFAEPGVFGKAAAQSFYFGEFGDWLQEKIREGETAERTFFLHWSRFDYLIPGSVDARAESQRLAELLRGKGFQVLTLEVADGAGWGMWRAGTDDILTALFPPSAG